MGDHVSLWMSADEHAKLADEHFNEHVDESANEQTVNVPRQDIS